MSVYGDTNPLGNGRDRAAGQGRQGGGEGLSNGGGRAETIRGYPPDHPRTLSLQRAAKEGQLDMGKGRRNGLVTWVFMS